MSLLLDDLRRGARAGALGGLAVATAAALRNRYLGRPPPYSQRRFISSLASRAGWRLSPAQVWVSGALFRLVYSMGFGLLFGALGGRYALRKPGAAGAALGTSILLLEHLTMPPLGITPPASHWTRAERLLLIAQTEVYGQVVARAYRRSTLSPAS